MNDRLMDAFENCLDEIKNGKTVEECLRNYPDLADDLRPPLEAARAAHSLSIAEVPSEIMARSRTHLLGRAAQLRSEEPAPKSFTRLPLIVFSAFMLALILILGSRELVVVSAKSLPGDSLYPIKLAVQDIRVRLAPNREIKHEIEIKYRDQRIEEVIDLLAINRIQMVSFEGTVNQMTPSKWNVSNITVILNESTKVIGDCSLGSLVEVEGLTTSDGFIEAHELHLREYEYIGQVDSMNPDSWVISSLQFDILSSTQIYSGAKIGDKVLVLVRTRDNGTQYALAIIRLPSYIKDPSAATNDIAVLTAGKNVGEKVEFSGRVDLISSSTWIVDGYSIKVSLLTEVKGIITPGDFVTIHAVVAEDGSLIAREIDLGGGGFGDDHKSNSDDGQASDDDSDKDSQGDDSDHDGDHGESHDNNGSDEDDNSEQDNKNTGDDGGSDDGSGNDTGGDDGGSDGGSNDDGSDHDGGSDDSSIPELPDATVEIEEP